MNEADAAPGAVSYAGALRLHARRDPTRAAVVHVTDEGTRVVTRGELVTWAAATARRLSECGVGAGDIVAVVSPNAPEVFVVSLASWMLGAVPMPLSHKLPEHERRAIASTAAPRACLVQPLGECPFVELPSMPPADPATFVEPTSPEPVSPHWKAIATGGSTGVPKVVLDNEPAVVDPLAPAYGMVVDGVQLVTSPLSHSGGFINSVNGLLLGNTLVLAQRFDAEQTLALIDAHQVDWVLLVPTMQHRVWRLGPEVRSRYDLSSLRVVMASGGPYPAWLKAEMIGWLGPDRVMEVYGGTERLGGTAISGREALERPGSVGRPRPGFEVRIADADGAEVTVGDVGEVWFRVAGRDTPTYTYVGVDGRARDGWDTYGDLGYVDADGYVYLVDRRTDLIVTGGANVYPAEVEAVLSSHPTVRSVAVIGLPDGDLGQRVHAVCDVGRDGVAGEPDGSLVDELRRFAAEHLVPYKVPRTVELVTEYLRDDAGKVRRAALRDARIGAQ